MKSCDKVPIMPNKDKNGNYKVQITFTEKEYQILRKEAYKMDKTVNQAVKELALLQARTKK